MMFRVLVLLALLASAWIGSAREQYITLFTETNFLGESLTIRSQHPNTPYFIDFVQHTKSFRCLGFWRAYNEQNYKGWSMAPCNFWLEVSVPDNQALSTYRGSIRHSGLQNISGSGIWLFSQSNLMGEEKIVTTPAANDFTFSPASFITTSFSNWTLFTGKNFDGFSTCFVSTTEIVVMNSLNSTYSNIQSVLRGCLGRIDSYLFGSELYEDVDNGIQTL